MKTKRIIRCVLLAVTLSQIPFSSIALNIRVKKIDTNVMRSPGKNNKPAVPITYYNEAAKTFSITSRVSIPEVVIIVTKDGVEISNETMPINNGTVIEYNFTNDEAGEYVITIAVDNMVKNVDYIFVE